MDDTKIIEKGSDYRNVNKTLPTRLQDLWHKLTTPQAIDPDEARREYTTRVILLILSSIAVGITPLVFLGWITDIFDELVMIVAPTAVLVFCGGLWLAQLGHWRVASYVPPVMVYLLAVFNNYLDGPGSAAMLYYAVAVILALMLQGVKTEWVMLVLGLGAYAGLGLAHTRGMLPPGTRPENALTEWVMDVTLTLVALAFLLWFLINQYQHTLAQSRAYATEIEAVKNSLEEQVAARTVELQASYEESQRLHRQILESQQQMIRELSSPVIPLMDAPDGTGGIIVMPLVGTIDSIRARDITRSLLAGISQHRARTVIIDVTGVSLMDTGIVNHLTKTIQAAKLKGAQTIVTGISNAVAESIVELGIDWSKITTLSDLQTGLLVALDSQGQVDSLVKTHI